MEITRTATAGFEAVITQRAAHTGHGRVTEGEQSAVPVEAQQPVSQEQVEQAVKDIRKVVSAVSSDLQFSVDEDSGRTMVKVVDAKTKEVIRQIPGEEVLAIRRALDKMKGLLLRMEA